MRASMKSVLCALLLIQLAGGCTPDRNAGAASGEVLRVGYLVPITLGEFDALHGAMMGAEEASRAGELVGRRFELLTARAATPESTLREAQRMLGQGVFALVGGFDPETCQALGRLAEQAGVLFFNVGCRADALRDTARLRNTFHVEASDAMHASLLSGTSGEGAVPALWHPGLFRYGARQLNDRYEQRFDASLHSGG